MTTDLTREDIFAACEAILVEDATLPTYPKIRERTGKQGSNTTLARYLPEWTADLAERVASAAGRPDIPAPLWDLTTTAWDKAISLSREIATRDLADQKRETEEAVEAAEAARETAITRANAAIERAERLAEQLEAAEQSHVRASKVGDQRREAITELTAKVASLTEALSAAREDGERSRAALAKRGEEIERERDRAAHALDAETARGQRELDAARSAAAAAATAADKRERELRAKAEESSREYLEAARKLAALASTHDQLQAAIRETKDALHARSVALTAREKEVERLTERLDHRTGERDQLKAQGAALSQQIARRDEQINRKDAQIEAFLEREPRAPTKKKSAGN